ncbi:clostripain-related cysteine peptidase [Treponema zioleckii]|uniref:clostripain-related cysteine peptidase n=1 Tax=Treponema zioleckii TaxID=331680 RepID=UPI00168B3D41|nr:clostripain-related cysteine peptidase [Treponema zioleckii]
MKKLKFACLAGIILSAFSLISCGADDEIATEQVSVTFKTDGYSEKIVNLPRADCLSSSQLPVNPYRTGNYFMYWSESKESQEKAVRFDFNEPIIENKTLYAIFSPELVSISNVSATDIEIKLYSNSCPLEDGSYVGLNFKHSTDNKNFKDVNLGIPSKSENYGSYKYVTYTFDSPLPEGMNYFKVTSKHETCKKEYRVAAPVPVTNLSAKADDSYVELAFSPAEGWDSYIVKVFDGSEEVASKTVWGKNVEFFGLTNDTEYTFKVFTGKTEVFAQTTATPTVTKKETDWLLAMYMDGDNDLHEPIWLDLNEAEYGVYNIRSYDSDYDAVTAVAIWDGAVSWLDTDENGNPVTVTPQIGDTGTYLYEVGEDYSCKADYVNDRGCVLSSKTKNLSYTAPWLTEKTTVDTSVGSYHGEVNMGDKQTLINYLNWINAHYTAKKGIILQFSDHGGGPRRIRYVKTSDGRMIKVGDTSGRRALCWDDSSRSDFLKTKDVSEALQAAGFGPSNKLGMILMDVCLGSSLEDAYQFKDYANYLAASPNTIPGSGLDYTDLMKAFKKNCTLEQIGKQILEDYKKQYSVLEYWNYYAQQAFGKNYYALSEDEQSLLEWLSDLGIPTFTITDLSKIEDVKTAVDSLCNVLLSDSGKLKTVYVDENGVFSPTATDQTENFVKYLGQHHANIVNLFGNNEDGSKYSIDGSIYYQGSFAWLYDIGYLADFMNALSAPTFSASANENAWLELNEAAIAVSQKLGNAIAYSWRDSKSDISYRDFYRSIDKCSDYKHHYGLSICGASLATNGENLSQGTLPDFYKSDLAFGRDSKWGDLLEYWFGK